MSSLWCACCGKGLSQEKSIERGVGPICTRNIKFILSQLGDAADKVDLPFDPASMNIICKRDELGVHFNIYQIFRHHSPTGMEWGYGGSGPADFALNVMELFIRDASEKPTLPIWDGQLVTYTGYKLHQDFKDQFIATLPREGGVIAGSAIREWICEKTGGRYFFS